MVWNGQIITSMRVEAMWERFRVVVGIFGTIDTCNLLMERQGTVFPSKDLFNRIIVEIIQIYSVLFYPLTSVPSFQYTSHSTTYLEHRGRLHEISMIDVWINHCHLCFFGNRDDRFNSQIWPQLWADVCALHYGLSCKFTLLKMFLQYVWKPWWFMSLNISFVNHTSVILVLQL